jgi:hypothetical protein
LLGFLRGAVIGLGSHQFVASHVKAASQVL